MHIVLYHNAVIPPKRYGGTERVIDWLAKALISLGHSVTLIVEPGSFVPGAQMIFLQKGRDWLEQVPQDSDLVHLWATPHRLPKKPFLVTIEGNGQINEIFHPNTVFVSRKHAELHGGSHFVYNGIDPEEYDCDEHREPYLVFLAKASWKVKNLEGAIQIANKSGHSLKVMGSRNWPLHIHRLFSALPRKIQYLGMLDDIQKRKVLRKAKALLFPVRWHEPFGVAITEALASGCPVYGTPYGSLPEIVTPETGTLNSNASELVHSILNQKIAPQTCRQRVYQGFTHLQMAHSYLKYYEQILAHGSLNPPQDSLKWNSPASAQTLLPWTPI